MGNFNFRTEKCRMKRAIPFHITIFKTNRLFIKMHIVKKNEKKTKS